MSPAKALPLFPQADVKAYKISDKPCGPLLFNPASPACVLTAMAVKARIQTAGANTAISAITPKEMPAIEIKVMNDKKPLRFLARR